MNVDNEEGMQSEQETFVKSAAAETTRKVKKQKKEDELLKLATNILQKPHSIEDVFGQQVVSTLKLIEDPLTKQQCMFKIQSVLNDSYTLYLKERTVTFRTHEDPEDLLAFLSSGGADE